MKTFFLFIAALIILGLGWYYRAGVKIVTDALVSPYEPLMQKVKPVITPKPSPPPEWEKINIPSFGLSLNIPPDWVFDNEAKIRSASGQTAIAISANSGVLVPDVFNQDLFRKIYNLKTEGEFTESHLDEEIKFKKIESGKILTGQSYTIFVWDFRNTQLAVQTLLVRAFILKDSTLIIFTLNNSTDEGIKFLKRIVSLASLN